MRRAPDGAGLGRGGTTKDDPAIRVVLADDSVVVRDTLASLISREPGLEVVGVAADADEAIRLVARTRPHVAILDLRMPGNGVSAAEAIRKASPETHVMALSANVEERSHETIGSGLEIDILPKGLPSEALLEAIRAAATAGPPSPPSA